MKQECPTYLKTIEKSKAFAATLSDTEPEEDSDNEDDGILNAFTTTVNPTEGIDEEVDDEDSKMKSYITRQFKKFMKNANANGFDKDRKQSSSSQFKNQDRRKKDAKEGSQYTVPPGPKCFECQGLDI